MMSLKSSPADATRRPLALAFFALSVFMLTWLVAAPLVMSQLQRESDAAEAELRKACRAQQPLWALWRRHALAEACFARALVRLRATQPFPPPSLTLKHHKHFDVISTHHVGAFIWTAAGMAQFGLSRSTPAERQRHRLVGRLYMLGAALLTLGFIRINRHDLHFDNDFRAYHLDVPARNELEHAGFMGMLCALQLWFVFTAGNAWAAARARQFEKHRVWMVRHVASGLWVVAMRALAVLFNVLVFVGIACGMGAPSGVMKARLFQSTAILGTVLSIAGGELFVQVR